eukprot:c17546_g1_i1.p1 GENE.c17546_g1_i1~~c17546_g1_i1.p1  ORF type:complete len:400 (-),score=80.47 c17546_g1_i1:101-1300(-)
MGALAESSRMSVQWESALGSFYPHSDTSRIVEEIRKVQHKHTLKPSLVRDANTWPIPEHLNCIHLVGVVPFKFKSSTFNAPVRIILPKNFPRVAPEAFVVPPDDMIIAVNHQHVDLQGRCYVAYLSSWSGNSSILGLCEALTAAFNNAPPVFKRSSSTQPSAAQVTQPAQSRDTQNPYKSQFPHQMHQLPQPVIAVPVKQAQTNLPTLSTQPATSLPPIIAPPPQSRPSPPPSPQPIRKSEKEIQVEKLTQKTTEHLNGWRNASSTSEHELAYSLDQLQRRANSTSQVVANLSTIRNELMKALEALEDYEQRVLEQQALLEYQKPLTIDEQVEPVDVRTRQLLDLVSEDKSISDAMFWLNKALEAEKIDFETWFKSTRSLGKEQYLLRALIVKIVEKSL